MHQAARINTRNNLFAYTRTQSDSRRQPADHTTQKCQHEKPDPFEIDLMRYISLTMNNSYIKKIIQLRKTYKMVLYSSFVAAFIVLFSNYFVPTIILIVMLFATVFAFGTFFKRLKCPYCSSPLLLRKVEILGKEKELFDIRFPQRCHHCKSELSASISEE